MENMSSVTGICVQQDSPGVRNPFPSSQYQSLSSPVQSPSKNSGGPQQKFGPSMLARPSPSSATSSYSISPPPLERISRNKTDSLLMKHDKGGTANVTTTSGHGGGPGGNLTPTLQKSKSNGTSGRNGQGGLVSASNGALCFDGKEALLVNLTPAII